MKSTATDNKKMTTTRRVIAKCTKVPKYGTTIIVTKLPALPSTLMN